MVGERDPYSNLLNFNFISFPCPFPVWLSLISLLSYFAIVLCMCVKKPSVREILAVVILACDSSPAQEMNWTLAPVYVGVCFLEIPTETGQSNR